MMLGSAFIAIGVPSEAVQARFQNLSAGMLVGAVLSEVFPLLMKRLKPQGGSPEWHEVLAAAIGFALSLALMYSLKSLDLEGEGGEEVADPAYGGPEGAQSQQAAERGLSSFSSEYGESTGHVSTEPAEHDEKARLAMVFSRLDQDMAELSKLAQCKELDRESLDETVHRMAYLFHQTCRVCKGAQAIEDAQAAQIRLQIEQLASSVQKLREFDLGQLSFIYGQVRVAATTLHNIHSHTERASFRRWRMLSRSATGIALPAKAIPWGLVFAVTVDATVDGMLIGLASAVSWSSGLIMACATTLEMFFLGYSFSSSVIECGRHWPIAGTICCLPPCAILLSCVASGVAWLSLEDCVVFTALIAFSLVALLFLVLQELVIEAYQKDKGDAWHVSVFLYFGLLISVFLGLAF